MPASERRVGRSLAMPSVQHRPLVFTELFDDRDGDWWKVREREIAVIPHVGNDVVLWVDIQGQGAGGVGDTLPPRRES